MQRTTNLLFRSLALLLTGTLSVSFASMTRVSWTNTQDSGTAFKDYSLIESCCEVVNSAEAAMAMLQFAGYQWVSANYLELEARSSIYANAVVNATATEQDFHIALEHWPAPYSIRSVVLVYRHISYQDPPKDEWLLQPYWFTPTETETRYWEASPPLPECDMGRNCLSGGQGEVNSDFYYIFPAIDMFLYWAYPGRPPWDDCAECNDPINLTDGNVSHRQTDISISTPDIPLEFTRQYNSLAPTDAGFLGPKWHCNFSAGLSYTNAVFQLYTAAGLQGVFTNKWVIWDEQGNQRWKPVLVQSGNQAKAVSDGRVWDFLEHTNGSKSVLLPEGKEYLFDADGHLILIQNQLGHFIALTHSNNLLTRAQHSNGQFLDFSYSNGLLVQISTASTNLFVRYEYNDRNEPIATRRLVDGEEFTTTYAYDDSTNATHCMTQRITVAGNDWRWEYECGTNGVMTGHGIRTWLAPDGYMDARMDYSRSAAGVSYVSYTASNGRTNNYEYQFNPATKRIESIYGPFEQVTDFQRGITYETDDFGNRISSRQFDYYNGTNTALTLMPYDTNSQRLISYAYGYNATPTNITYYSWDTNSLLLTTTDPEGFSVSNSYNGRLLESVTIPLDDGDSLVTRYAYTTNGLLAAITNANGNAIRYEYGTNGYLSAILPEAAPPTYIQCNPFGHITRLETPDNRATEFNPDPLGRIQSITYPDASSETFQYNGSGKLTNSTDRLGHQVSQTHIGGHLASITRHGSSTNLTISYNYDPQFNTLAIHDELNRPVEAYQLDSSDRPIQVSNVDSQTMLIAYALADYVQSITRFDASSISNHFNGDGLLARQSYIPPGTNQPLLADEFDYYRNGLLRAASLLAWNGFSFDTLSAISNSYDKASRLTEEIASSMDGPTWRILRQYDRVGNVTNLAETELSAFFQTRTYDHAERLTQISSFNPQPSSINLSYNTNNGLPSALSLPNGLTAEYQYDLMDRVSSIEYLNTNATPQLAIHYAYNLMGMITQKITSITSPNASTSTTFSTYEYDEFYRLTSETAITPSTLTTSIITSAYSYDAAGNRTAKTTPNGEVTSFRSEPGNRLISWAYEHTGDYSAILAGHSTEPIGTDERWGQLWVSNQTAQTLWVDGTNFGVSELAVLPGTNRILAAIRDQAGNTTIATNDYVFSPDMVTNAQYAYNPAGCLTQIVMNSSATSRTVNLEWNLKYQLTQISSFSLHPSSFSYDPLGRMNTRVENGVTNYLLYDGPHLIAEADPNLYITKRFTYGPGMDNILSMTVTDDNHTNTFFYLKDQQNSVLAITDDSGQIVETYSYDAWGRTKVFDANGFELSASSIGNRFAWQGREIDWNTGLYYFRNRWYDPITGRWLSNDPIGISGGLNQYVFCGNNPVNMVDPWGVCGDDDGDGGVWGAAWQSIKDQFSFDPDLSGLAQIQDSGAGKGWEYAYWSAWGVSAAAAATALTAGSFEAVTGVRIEIHGPHFKGCPPHLQGIKGSPGIHPYEWGKTIWRWPPH